MGLRPVLYITKKGASDKVYQLLARGRWFSPSTPASSTTKTGRHDIPEILLKVALNTKNQIKSTNCRPDNRVVFKILNSHLETKFLNISSTEVYRRRKLIFSFSL